MARDLTYNEADLALTLYDMGSLYPWIGSLNVNIITQIGVVMREFVDRASMPYDRVIGFSRMGLSFAHAFSSAVSPRVPILAFGEVGHRARSLIGDYIPGERVLMLDVRFVTSLGPPHPDTVRDIYILRTVGLAISGSSLLFLVEDENGGASKVRQEFPFLDVHTVFRKEDVSMLISNAQ